MNFLFVLVEIKGKNTEKYSHSTFCGRRMMRNQTNTYTLHIMPNVQCSMLKWINKMKIEMDKKRNFQLFNIELRIHANTFPFQQHTFSQSCNFMTSSRQKKCFWRRKLLRNNLLKLWSFCFTEYSCGLKKFKKKIY